MRAVLALVYRFKPLRTAMQAFAGTLTAATIFGVDWRLSLGSGAVAGLYAFAQIWGEGGDMLAADKRVTGSKPSEPVLPQSRLDAMHDVFDDGNGAEDYRP